MRAIKLITCLLLAVATSTSAQTYPQKGVVRMITTSSLSPITPVKGVQVAIGGSVSKATDSNGVFTVQVTKQFKVNDVVPSDEYILALPTKGKSYTHSPNDLDVVVTTKTQKEADYKRLYNQIRAKYDAQSDELLKLKQQYKAQLERLEATDKDYAKLKARLDSVQHLYLNYINNDDKIEKEIRSIANELSITDYQTLDSINQRIYDLKCAGEWKSISDMLVDDIMHGDAAKYLNEGLANKRRADEELKQAQKEDEEASAVLDERLEILEEAAKKQNTEK